MESFGVGLQVAVVGASGGLGRAFVERLAAAPNVARIAAFTRSESTFGDPKVERVAIDFEQEETIAGAAARESLFHLVIVASGVLHDGAVLRPEKTWRALDGGALERVFRVNAVGPALVAKHFLPLLPRDRKAAFAAISARVGSIGDNRLGGWYAYRASKAALNMLIKTCAIELARRNPTALCVGLHPGTVDTALSKPFQAGVDPDSLFTPRRSAGCLLDVLDRLTPAESGKVFAWDGAQIAY